MDDAGKVAASVYALFTAAIKDTPTLIKQNFNTIAVDDFTLHADLCSKLVIDIAQEDILKCWGNFHITETSSVIVQLAAILHPLYKIMTLHRRAITSLFSNMPFYVAMEQKLLRHHLRLIQSCLNINHYMVDLLKNSLKQSYIICCAEFEKGHVDFQLENVSSNTWKLKCLNSTTLENTHDYPFIYASELFLSIFSFHCLSFVEFFNHSHLANHFESVVETLIYEQIHQYSYTINPDVLYKPVFSDILHWYDTRIVPWMNIVQQIDKRHTHVSSLSNQLRHHVYQCFIDMRKKELFEILIEFPSSQPALEDLQLCIAQCQMKMEWLNEIVSALQVVLRKRLLHPGAETTDILLQYISTVRALRLLDTSGLAAEDSTQSLRKYLANERDDTVRCIVSGFTDSNSVLYGELQCEQDENSEMLSDSEEDSDIHTSLFDEGDDDYSTPWIPAPIHAGRLTKTQLKRWRSRDTLRAFVQIFGSRGRFLSEFQQLLCDRLLEALVYDTSKERTTIEWLKLKFGENTSSLHHCEIMLKDVADSKRIDHAVHSGKSLTTDQQASSLLTVRKHQHAISNPLHPLILSRLFWPKSILKNPLDGIILPNSMLQVLNSYTVTFSELKPQRKLSWHTMRGRISLEIQLADRTLNITASPLQTAVLFVMQETPSSCTSDDICRDLKVSVGLVKKAMSFWCNQGVVRESNNSYYVLEHAEQSNGWEQVVEEFDSNDFEEATGRTLLPAASFSNYNNNAFPFSEHDVSLYWNFIASMLTNLGALQIERIHTMLAMFIQAPMTYDKTIEQLQLLLRRMIQEERLEFSAGHYKLKK